MHSTTKFLGGHSDVQGGALVFKDDADGSRAAALRRTRTLLGGVSSPFNDWLILRGLRTLSCRVERHAANALAVARELEAHRKIERVFYPGLESHPGHEIAKRQMRAFGGMLSFTVTGGRQAAVDVASRLKVFTNATSLGASRACWSTARRRRDPGRRTPDNLLRASVGLEHADDLVGDLLQALS